MENLEEVLQVLDEFQKMRPTEIPRQLEEYLCWVAKTGDPVYQWSLIKTLFREKLTRVMTDFYESCPTLDLAPCPNVEHFNYDSMKSNLLERLESFANAPFTVQRICELLTAPRKEYNRVDKFMRAIEKNILVVSTREPGPVARRNENGDGMVNGSVDEDTSVTQPPQDVEMEYWEKDCSSTVTISVHTVENETPLLQTIVPTNTVVKNVFGTEEMAQEKVESTSKSDIAVSNFIPTTSEFTSVPNLTSSPQTQDSQIEPTIQNLSTIVPEASGIVGDVSEAIMNEDTSSQPSLELENDAGETADSSRKLQTTFQTKDFNTNESKSSKFYVDNSKLSEKSDIGMTSLHVQDASSKANDAVNKTDNESKTVPNSKVSSGPIVENVLNTSNENLEDTIKSTDAQSEDIQMITDANLEDAETNVSSKNDTEKLANDTNIIADDAITEETTSAATSADVRVDVENLNHDKEAELTGNTKPIVEEPCSKDNATEQFDSDREKNTVTITETIEDESRIIKSIVPDPIPIIEEPKDAKVEDTSENLDIQDVTESSQTKDGNKRCAEDSKDDSNVTELEGKSTMRVENSEAVTETTASKKIKKESAAELMEVDEEETLSVFQQDDEPMEQGAAQSSRS